MDALDCCKFKGLKQQQAATQIDAFTIKTAPGSINDNYNVVQPHTSQLDALPAPDVFHSAPIFLSSDPRCPTQAIGGCSDPTSPVLLNQQLSLDTELFSGSLLVNIKGFPGTPSRAFRNSKWLGQTVIQGRFKQHIAADELWVGQELWNKPLLPLSFQKLIFNTAAKIFSATSRITTQGEGVGFLNPLLAMAQLVNVAAPGSEPCLQGEVLEDARLLVPALADKRGKPIASTLRQKHFDKPANLAAAHFSSEHVYTFVIGQSILDMMQYRLSLGGLLNLDLCPILNGQPLQMMCKNIRDNKTILSVLVWHERLNYPAGIKAMAGSLSSSRLSTASSSCSTLNDSSTLGGCSSGSISDCCSSSDDSSTSSSGHNSSGRFSRSSSSICSSGGCCCAESPGRCSSCSSRSSNSSSSSCDGSVNDDALSDYCSACSQFSSSDSTCDVADVGDALIADVMDMPSNIASSTARAPAVIEDAAVAAAAAYAAAEHAHNSRAHGTAAAAAVVRQRKQKRGSAPKRFKAWLKKLLK
eukprot:jgi/Sobl393_1/14888/SZX68548.1